jgi:S-layer homology domain
MLFKQNNRLTVYGIILTSLLTLLSGCGNGAVLEGLVGADPALKKKVEEVSNQTQDPLASANPNARGIKSGATNNPDNDPAKVKPLDGVGGRNGNVKVSSGENSDGNLLLNFTETFPVYPQAKLLEIKSSEDKKSGMMLWGMQENRQTVADYYLAELSTKNWEVIKPFTINPQRKITRAIAVKDNVRVELSLLPPVNNQTSNNQASKEDSTRLSVVYHPLDQDIPQSSIAQWSNSSKPASTTKQTKSGITTQTGTTPALNNRAYNPSNSSVIDFTDLDEVPPPLQQPIESVAALNILTPYTKEANVDLTKFAPNEVITRGEYARWLIAANNRYYADNPGKKIYLATENNQPAFNDVNANHPDFAAIQSLAEAGLIPSRLTEDSTNLLFRPDAPLIRADLVIWKVPLDTRKSLPKASIQAIEESWGFQDAADIDSSATRALYADFQNGDRANVRRMFGYTTIFQPKKPVTRAEAAASLWYFGFQGDGITAKEVLQSAAKTKR